MRKPTSFFVSTLSLLLFLSLTFAACGGSTVDSSVAPSPSLAHDPVNQVYALAWSPDGKYLALASQDQTVQVWEALTGKWFLTYRGHAAEVWAVSWSPDGKHIASVGDGGVVQLWNATTGKQGWLLHP